MTFKELREGVSDIPVGCHKALMAAANSVKEETTMRKKMMTSVLIAAMMLVLLTATAFAVYTLTRSEQDNMVSQARKALMSEYGLTTETLGLFYVETEQTGDKWDITFVADGFYPPLLGDYVVKIAPETPVDVSWTHDNVDPALWQEGELTAPVWGQPQMLYALKNRDEADDVAASLWAGEATIPPQGKSVKIVSGDTFMWNGQSLKLSTPSGTAMPKAEALALAKQVLIEETGLTEAELNEGSVSIEFYEREEGTPIWAFQFYLVNDDIEVGLGVMLDAHSGEILSTGITTGGNG